VEDVAEPRSEGGREFWNSSIDDQAGR
jgi:hypothetical protein